MQCVCVYDDCANDNGPKAFGEKDRVARKEHKCCECKKIIMPGETYRYESGIWDTGPEEYKTCLDCVSIRNIFFCHGWIYQDMLVDLKEYIRASDGQVSGDWMQELTPRARDMVADIIHDVIMEDED